MRTLALFLVLLFIAAPPGRAADPATAESEEINYLIGTVETLEGAKFIRNDAEYDPKAAADHLRLKLERAGSRVKTVDDFIRYCASTSSVSGKPYQIRFADGRMVKLEDFLRQKLAGRDAQAK
jgi:hypothetical protein